MRLLLFCFSILAFTGARSQIAVDYNGSNRVFHTMEILFTGGTSFCEQEKPDNTHLFRATFTHSTGKVIRIYGHWAADGNADSSEARCGNSWRIYFTPTLSGQWTMTTDFHTGVTGKDLSFATGTNGELDGISDTLPTILETDALVPDFRKMGVVTNRFKVDSVKSPYPYVTGEQRSFVFTGAGSPEDFLGYTSFDATPEPGGDSTYSTDYAAHMDDFKLYPQAVLWVRDSDTLGREIYGALEFLYNQRINNLSLILNNATGDGRNVYPYVDKDSTGVFDISKTDQWFNIIQYANVRGINIELTFAESENDDNVFGSSTLSQNGFNYLKRMVSTYGSLPGITYAVGEECDLDAAVAAEALRTINTLDAYDHLLGLNTRKRNRPPSDGLSFQYWYDRLAGFTAPADTNVTYAPMQVQGTLDGTAVTFESMLDDAKPYMDSTNWVFNIRESGTGGQGSVKPDDPLLSGNSAFKYRRQILYAGLFRGFGGVNIYFGSTYPGKTDISSTDFRDYDTAWAMQRVARSFFMKLECLECFQYSEDWSAYTASRIERFWVMYNAVSDAFIGYGFPLGDEVIEPGTLKINIQTPGNYRVSYVNPETGFFMDTFELTGLPTGLIDLPIPAGRLDEDWIVVVVRWCDSC